jgi:hypothetical protein
MIKFNPSVGMMLLCGWPKPALVKAALFNVTLEEPVV